MTAAIVKLSDKTAGLYSFFNSPATGPFLDVTSHLWICLTPENGSQAWSSPIYLFNEVWLRCGVMIP